MFKQKIDRDREKQLDLFAMIEEINCEKLAKPDFQVETKPLGVRIKDAISKSISKSELKRYEIAGKMSEHLGVEITDSMLNSWTAESKEGHRMPAEYYPVFCKIVQDFSVLEILVAAAGGRMTKTKELYYLEMGMWQQAEENARKERAKLRREWERMQEVAR